MLIMHRQSRNIVRFDYWGSFFPVIQSARIMELWRGNETKNLFFRLKTVWRIGYAVFFNSAPEIWYGTLFTIFQMTRRLHKPSSSAYVNLGLCTETHIAEYHGKVVNLLPLNWSNRNCLCAALSGNVFQNILLRSSGCQAFEGGQSCCCMKTYCGWRLLTFRK